MIVMNEKIELVSKTYLQREQLILRRLIIHIAIIFVFSVLGNIFMTLFRQNLGNLLSFVLNIILTSSALIGIIWILLNKICFYSRRITFMKSHLNNSEQELEGRVINVLNIIHKNKLAFIPIEINANGKVMIFYAVFSSKINISISTIRFSHSKNILIWYSQP